VGVRQCTDCAGSDGDGEGGAAAWSCVQCWTAAHRGGGRLRHTFTELPKHRAATTVVW
jgi:hypothetical protein